MDQYMNNFFTEAIETHSKMVTKLQRHGAEVLITAAQTIVYALKNNGTIYICGNGGSAADAQHIAGELVGKFRRERKALPAVALSTNTSVLTSIANDYSYEDVFAKQVEGLIKKGDILWALSTSGASPNVAKAAKLAKEKGARVLAFTGRTDSELERIADVCFCADDESTARSQELHQLAYHIICDIIEDSFCK